MPNSFVWALWGTGFIFLMTTLGAALVFFFKNDAELRFQSVLTGFAAGVMTAASVWSLIIPAIEQTEDAGHMAGWLPAALGIAAGAAFLMALDALITRLGWGLADRAQGTPLLVTAITIHNIPEGMAVGLAFALAAGGEGFAAACALALGIGVQNFPEGAAVALPLRQCGMSRARAFLTGVLSGAVEPLFGLLVVLFAAGVAPVMPWLLSFAAGAMLYVAAHELIPAAEGRPGATGFLTGFIIMMVLDVALG